MEDEGHAFWKQHGVGYAGVFDFKDGSISRRVLDGYRTKTSSAADSAGEASGESAKLDAGRVGAAEGGLAQDRTGAAGGEEAGGGAVGDQAGQ